MANRTLLVISTRLDAEARAAVAAGRWPRKDFFELQRALNADVIDYGAVESSRAGRLLRRLGGMPVAQAWLAFTRCHRYDRIFTDGEHLAIPLAVLLRPARRAPRHVTIGHLLTTPAKRAAFRWLRPQRRIDLILLHAVTQLRVARDELGFRPEQTALVAYQTDTDYWNPRFAPLGRMPESSRNGLPLICTAGLEYRDYRTLIEAVGDLPVRVVIAAGSRWSTHPSGIKGALPANVQVTALDYEALRDLYAASNFVVVPLRDIDNQAGITTILEAMAMGKAIIVTATRGQRDVVRGRLCTMSGPIGDPLFGPAPFGVTGELATAETGLYVPPGDAAALRAAIQHLLDHPDQAARMGANGRRLVETHMNLDLFVERVAALLSGEPWSVPVPAHLSGEGAGSRGLPTHA